jgi:hypothetical protein
MRNFPIFVAICLTGIFPVSTAAQGTPAAGARLAAEARFAGDSAGDKAALSKQWEKGARMAADGEKLMRRSEARLQSLSRNATRFQTLADRATAARTKEEASQARGQGLIDEGRSLQAQAEAHFVAGSR